jgi:hypothetical protein
MNLKNLFHQASSFVVYVITISSASVLEVVTVFYFADLQSTGPLNSENKNPSMLCRDRILFAKVTSLMHVNVVSIVLAKNLIASMYVESRYIIASFTTR